MLARYAAEFASTGAAETSAFQGLSGGKMRQPATVGAPPGGGGEVGADVGAALGNVDGCAVGVGFVTGSEPPDDEATVPPPPPHAARTRRTNGMAAARRPETRMASALCPPPTRDLPCAAYL
jgi:hypothetical protein